MIFSAILGVESGAWYSDLVVLACGAIGGIGTLYAIFCMFRDTYRYERARIQAESNAAKEPKEDA